VRRGSSSGGGAETGVGRSGLAQSGVRGPPRSGRGLPHALASYGKPSLWGQHPATRSSTEISISTESAERRPPLRPSGVACCRGSTAGCSSGTVTVWKTLLFAGRCGVVSVCAAPAGTHEVRDLIRDSRPPSRPGGSMHTRHARACALSAGTHDRIRPHDDVHTALRRRHARSGAGCRVPHCCAGSKVRGWGAVLQISGRPGALLNCRFGSGAALLPLFSLSGATHVWPMHASAARRPGCAPSPAGGVARSALSRRDLESELTRAPISAGAHASWSSSKRRRARCLAS